MRKTYADCHNLGNIPDNNKILLTKTKDKKPFKTCVVCGPDHRAYGYCISCMELLCAECVRAHKQVGMTSKHNIAEVKQYLHPENDETKCDVVVCDYCGPQTSAVVHCSDCYEFLCEYCLNDHKRVKMTSNHRLIDIQQLSIPSETSRKFICESHNKIGLCTCDTCEATVLCHQCLPAHHKHLLRKPHNFQLFLPSFITCLYERDKKIDKLVKEVTSEKGFATERLKRESEYMRENVYNIRRATQEQKQDYSRKFKEIMEKRVEVIESNEKEILAFKGKLLEIQYNWEQCKDGGYIQQESLYTQLLEVLSERIPTFVYLDSNEADTLRKEFTESLFRKLPRRFRAPASDSEDSEEEEDEGIDGDDSDSDLKYYDSEVDLALTKQQIQDKYADIFEDHTTKNWQLILKEAEDMISARSDFKETTRKVWSSMAFCVRKSFAKFGISIISPRAVKYVTSILLDEIYSGRSLDSLQSYYLSRDDEYYNYSPLSDTCKKVVKYITYVDGYELNSEEFHNFIKIHQSFNELSYQEVDEHVVCLDNVSYSCCFELC